MYYFAVEIDVEVGFKALSAHPADLVKKSRLESLKSQHFFKDSEFFSIYLAIIQFLPKKLAPAVATPKPTPVRAFVSAGFPCLSIMPENKFCSRPITNCSRPTRNDTKRLLRILLVG